MASNDSNQDLVKKLVRVSRVSKTVKGGRRLSFSALVVVGDQKGRVGFGKGKANVVAPAVKKATEAARKRMINVPLREGRTLHHDVVGHAGSGHLLIRSAAPGTGIIAGGAARAVFESLGIQDVVCKSLGSSNSGNMLRAVFNALSRCASPQTVAAMRNVKTKDLVSRREA